MLSWLSSANASTFMPPVAWHVAEKINSLYTFFLIASLIACVLVIGGMIIFVTKYRRRSENDKTAYISHNGLLEFLWSFIPFVIFMVLFGWGWLIYHEMRAVPQKGLEIQVVGQKWFWDFLYKSGKKSTGELYVPVNTPVKLIITASDVLHSFYIPAFRVKQDAVPGRYTSLWFQADKEGDYQVFCAEFCGDQHSGMLAKIKVLSQEKYEEWLAANPYKGLSMEQIGQQIFQSKCAICHNTTAETKVGPGLKGVFGHKVELANGQVVEADENYLRTSILDPGSQVVKGFPAAMPTFAGQLTEEELAGLITYIKSLE